MDFDGFGVHPTLVEMCSFRTLMCVCLQVLNEVVVDRGPSSYLSNVDLYLDGRLITSVQGDGESSHIHVTNMTSEIM